MPVALRTLVAECNRLLRPDDFRDYCPNGLQIEGGALVSKIVTGVTASQALIDAAIAAGAEAILVHHGYFWQGEAPEISGMKKRRIKTLLENDISLLAYHLPLDAHPELGNNAQLAMQLGFSIQEDLFPKHKSKVGVVGELLEPCDAATLAERLQQRLQRSPLHIAGKASVIRSIAWCTGSAQHYIEAAQALGVDAYLSGEVSEQTVHYARETGIHYFAAGHHATERYGVQALGTYLAEHFSIAHQFIDIDNPV